MWHMDVACDKGAHSSLTRTDCLGHAGTAGVLTTVQRQVMAEQRMGFISEGAMPCAEKSGISHQYASGIM